MGDPSMYDNERWLLTLVDGVSFIQQSLDLLFVWFFNGERLKATTLNHSYKIVAPDCGHQLRGTFCVSRVYGISISNNTQEIRVQLCNR